ncbi:tRNA (adenosine(37)-N6)-dimethylallyltransferase MiaA [Brachybacterium saurashtrense]|uniref:tRNA dimethylallyltransferase n=1 Tax=Brachybacterium saurashtrense TaxID=556288 RepID=A0A345YL11_9MICO|nr:tRNA (adenosine(37)-N6)-dimethylallyltransferase MiaA [Brachybacterium saurashtrense]AXK44613.1 tRNA (adenosine(37)-N6)-dimethylallyltransferase MiaA [Brachybacterium saurashtrense]RRR23225.1 tRNA (adenosine(37)-N6)-dimethylallyltransferase MiaA [Brachybacterium saurashtrense]
MSTEHAPAGDPRAHTPLVAVVGATATGKSDLAIALAERLDGEVINADALQLYRGMDIGTAKVTAEERRGVPHHLLDVLEVTEEASVSAYQSAARQAIAAIRARGRTPILVGGSGLYVRAALDDIEFPPTDPAVRARLEARAEADGAPALHRELSRRDPEAAASIGVHDTRRIVRALEVGELTGRPFAAFLPRPHHHDPLTVQLGLQRERAALHERVALRVHRMVEQGFLDEIRALRGKGLDRGRTARRAIGYEQGLAVLDGALSCAEAIESTIVGTRRLVRKQDTWFRRDQRVTWFDAAGGEDLADRATAHVARAARATARPAP